MAKQNNPLAAIFERVSEPEPAMPEEVWRPYGVFMTPRSGSTWLAELMREAGLGFPNEWLNHARMDREIRERGYTSVKGYLRSVLAEHVGSSGASGIELPLLQVMHAYELEDIFSILGPSARYMFLRRENIGPVDEVDSQGGRSVIQDWLLGGGLGSRVDDGRGVGVFPALRGGERRQARPAALGSQTGAGWRVLDRTYWRSVA